MTRVRWLIDIQGTVHGDVNGVRRGQITECDDDHAQRYCALGYTTAELHGELPRPYYPGGPGGVLVIGNGCAR
jgi:hypothetical protein